MKNLLLLAASAALLISPPIQAASTISVLSYGATGNGSTDDTRAIQAAINALEATGGGTLAVPAGTYLLNSYSPSPHPWFFYNLRVGSNIMIQASTGAKFLQGAKGRAPLPAGASNVATSVLVFGSANYVINTFQDTGYNGGFYKLKATKAKGTTVTMATSSQASHFKVGDYVAIYSSTTGDVIPSETSQVTSVSAGLLGLAHPLARAFSTPVIAKVTALATVNMGVSDLIVQGTEPLNINEGFNFTATGNTFISDTSVGGSNICGLIMNDLRGVNFANNVITSVGPTLIDLELPQRNSQDVTIASNTFNVVGVGFGEYGAHWTLTGNTFNVHPSTSSNSAISFGGYDVLFSGNTVTGSTPGPPLIADWVGVDAYGPYVGQIRVTNNVINCGATALANCLNVAGVDTVVTGNTFAATGKTQQGILVQGPQVQNAVDISSNKMSFQSVGQAIVLNLFGAVNDVASCNTITGKGQMGIYVTSPQAGQGKVTVAGDSISSGFTMGVNVDTNMLAVTNVSGSTSGCAH